MLECRSTFQYSIKINMVWLWNLCSWDDGRVLQCRDCSIWPFQWSMLLWMFNFHFQFWMIDCAKSWREPRPTHNQLWTSDRKPLIKYWKMPSERASRSSEGFKHAGRKKRRVKYFDWNRPKNAYLRQDLMRSGSERGRCELVMIAGRRLSHISAHLLRHQWGGAPSL